MAEEPTAPAEPQAGAVHITFNVKTSSDSKHVVTVPETMTVLELKQKLSTSEFADIPAERQRLIYSGRVLKDPDVLSTYKIKDNNTVHMVKSAAASQQQPSTSSASAGTSTAPSATNNPATAGVPQNIAAGTGNDPLAGLTGARYAGFAQMPSASSFGADGGLNPANNPEEFMRMLENPMFQSEMNEAMNNPNVIRMMQNMPQFRNNPMLRQMLENPEFRRMMTDPQFIRQSLAMSRMMAGDMAAFGGEGGTPGGGMPAPGVTDNTPQQTNTGTGTAQPQTGTEAHPFGLFAGMGGTGQANPFAALFGGGGAAPFGNTGSSGTQPSGDADAATQGQGDNSNDNNAQQNPMASLANLMNLEALMRGAQGAGGAEGTGDQGMQPPPWLQAMNEQMTQQQPQDARPPEEQYESQLRQLNDMGFFEFDRNVRALRRSGGNVQGAVEYLLSDS